MVWSRAHVSEFATAKCQGNGLIKGGGAEDQEFLL